MRNARNERKEAKRKKRNEIFKTYCYYFFLDKGKCEQHFAFEIEQTHTESVCKVTPQPPPFRFAPFRYVHKVVSLTIAHEDGNSTFFKSNTKNCGIKI